MGVAYYHQNPDGHTIIKIPASGVADAILGAFLAVIPAEKNSFLKAVHYGMGNPTQCANHHVYAISFSAYVPLSKAPVAIKGLYTNSQIYLAI